MSLAVSILLVVGLLVSPAAGHPRFKRRPLPRAPHVNEVYHLDHAGDSGLNQDTERMSYHLAADDQASNAGPALIIFIGAVAGCLAVVTVVGLSMTQSFRDFGTGIKQMWAKLFGGGQKTPPEQASSAGSGGFIQGSKSVALKGTAGQLKGIRQGSALGMEARKLGTGERIASAGPISPTIS